MRSAAGALAALDEADKFFRRRTLRRCSADAGRKHRHLLQFGRQGPTISRPATGISSLICWIAISTSPSAQACAADPS